MALLPTVPTSFVPRAATGAPHARSDFSGAFSVLCYTILAIMFLVGIGLFFYGRILAAEITAKNTALAKAEAAIDPATVKDFVKLRDRLSSSRKLLDKHVAFSGFFTALGEIVPGTVRFNSLHLSMDDAGVTKVDGLGVARSFNSLSVASGAFATDGRLKDVIFSKMTIKEGGSVSFGFAATLDPKLVVFAPATSL